MKKLVISLLISLTSGVFAETYIKKSAEPSEKWSKLMNLINSEIQTIKNNKYSGPELKHRLFELYSEKIKLIKEKETQSLLKADPSQIAINGKESFFKNSQEQYITAQKYALSLIAQYAKYERISEIYYALAINSRDYGTSSETEQFLKLAINTSKEDDKTMYNAKTALAEYYYNNKNYNEAIGYYSDVLKKNDSEWYGKHLYNASWCHLKERNFKKALELIKESFESTKNKKYVSMKEQVMSAIAIFFVQADATEEGIDFFERNTNPSVPSLLLLAQASMSKNNFSLTEEVIRAAVKDTQRRKDFTGEMKVHLAQLDFYRENKKDDLYFETANNILDLNKKNKLDQDDLLFAINKIKEVAGFMQINLVKNKNTDEVKYNKGDFKKIMRYFDILSILDKNKKNQYRYYQGETALSIHNYQQALKYYVKAVMNSKKLKDNGDITKKSLEAMLSTIEFAQFKKSKDNQYTIFAFKNYLLFYPKAEKSQTIYQKLFNKYYELQNSDNAVNTLIVYKYNYPADEIIHREMLTQILDTYIKEKNTDKLTAWINKIEKGYLSFKSDYIQNSIAALGRLLFNKYQEMEKNGKIKEATEGYESIYDSKKYPNRIKAEAAYAIATLYQEQNNARESYKWLQKSLSIYEDKDLFEVTSSLLVLAKGYRLLQNFKLSSNLADLVSKRFCQEKFKDKFKEKNEFYEILISNSAVDKTEAKELLKIESDFSGCQMEKHFVEKTQLDNFERLILNEDQKEAIEYFSAHSDNEKMARQMGRFLKFKFWVAPANSKEKVKKEILAIYDKYPSIQIGDLFTQYEKVVEFREKIQNLTFTFTNKEKFDEEKYNSEIEQYFSIITSLNNEAIALSKESNPEEVILIRDVLARPYYALMDTINAYVPQGVDIKYIDGFKAGMRQITESLAAKGLQVDREKVAYLQKNNFFFEVQKHDKFINEKERINENADERLRENLNYHSAFLFSNTMDLTRGQKK